MSCIVCRYPYYLNNGNCLIGSSLLCRNGAIGNLPYQCSQTCGRLAYAAYQSDSVLYCLPNVWMLDSDITQLFMNWQSNELQGYTTTTACSETVFELNPLRFTLLLSPYYKLSLFFKLIPLITSPTVSITVTLSDNSSKSYSVITSNSVVICQAIYYNFTSKNIKDQLVSVIINANSRIGMSELLVQLYRCDSSCRLCYNSEQCIECYGSWFISSNVCVASCLGLIELYLPDGDPLNFTSKMCVLACPPGFYVQAVTKGVSMCIKC